MRLPTHPYSSQARDAAMRRLRRANRWTVALSAALTGLLTAVTGNASIGKTHKTASGLGAASRRNAPPIHHSMLHQADRYPSHPLLAPQQAPQPARSNSPEAEPSQPSSAASEATLSPTREAPPEAAAPSRQSSLTPKPTHVSAPAPEAPALPKSAPTPSASRLKRHLIVSGGS
jgi:membrane peptidoglycan carboxypeptidase